MGKKKRYTIGLGILFDYLYENYSSGIFKNIQQACIEQDLNFIGFEGGNSRGSVYSQYNKQKNSVIQLIDPSRVDGMILLAELVTNTLTDEEITTFKTVLSGIPVVSIGLFEFARSCLLIENRKGLRDVIAHLIQAHRCRNIAFIAGPPTSHDGRERLKAYTETLREFGIPVRSELIVPGDFYSLGAEAVRVLLDERRLKVDAIVSANDSMAIFAIKELRRRGLRVPADIAVTGFDDIEECQFIRPKLTTVRQSFFDLGRECVRTMRTLLEGGEVPKRIVMPARPVFRDSCGCSVLERVAEIAAPTSAVRRRAKKPAAARSREDFVQEAVSLIKNEMPALARGMAIEEVIRKLAAPVTGPRPRREDFLIAAALVWKSLLAREESIGDLYRLALLFFDRLRAFRADARSDDFIADLQRDTLVLIGLLYQEHHAWIRENIKLQDDVVLKFNRDFADTLNLEQLEDAVIIQLPKLQFNRFYICLYADKTRKSARILMQYQNRALREEPLVTHPFPARQLIPGRWPTATGFECMVVALYLKNEVLGYLVCDITRKIIEPIYDALATQFCSAIKGAMLQKEISDYTDQLENKVRERTLQLEMVNRDKTNFFINIAHEMKTPLTLISNYLDGYIEKYGLTEELRVVKSNFETLMRNMKYYLDTEKIERGKIVYRHDQLANASAILENETTLFREYAGRRKIRFSSGIAAGVFIMIDPDAIERIAGNLLDNAVRFTRPGGEIHVALGLKNGSAELVVRDTGIGLTEDERRNIFEPYYQAASAGAPPAGIGMGLSIVKKIADSAGASIRVESKKNEGTTITCTFKKGLTAPAVASRRRGGRFPARPSEPCEDVYHEGRSTVLIVEDNVEMLAYLRENTKDVFSVFCARSGEEALQKLKHIPKPDIIVSDIMMEGMDGYRLFEELLADKRYRDVPFIFLTAINSPQEKMKGLKRGAVDFITKPFSINELVAKMDSIMRVQDALKEKNILLLGSKIYKMLEDLPRGLTAGGLESERSSVDKLYFDYKISRKEIEVISLLKLGLLHKQIASRLNISINTVRTYIARIYKKCHVNSPIELFAKLKSL